MSLTYVGASSAWMDDLNSGTFYNDLTNGNADGTVSFADLKGLMNHALTKVQDAGSVTQSVYDDLTLIANNLNVGVAVDSYTASIFRRFILGKALNDQANVVYTGGQHIQSASDLSTGSESFFRVGQSAGTFKKLVDEWFNGLDNPDPWYPKEKTDTSAGYTKPTYVSEAGVPLWDTDGNASKHDVSQGISGDCVILSTLVTLAENNDAFLKSMIADNGDGTYRVRFYNGGDELWVTVDAQLPSKDGTKSSLAYNHSGWDADHPLWSSLIEKAFSEAASSGFFRHNAGVNSYYNVHGNYGADILAAFTNTAVTKLKYNDANWNAEKALVITALQNGNDVIIGSSKDFYYVSGQDEDGYDINTQTFVSSHELAIIGYDATTDKFRIRNPWGDNDDGSYDTEFDASWGNLAWDQASIAIDDLPSLGSSFRIEATGMIALDDRATAVGNLIRVVDLDGTDNPYVKLKVIGDGELALNGATNHASASQTAAGFIVVSEHNLSVVQYTATGVDSSAYLVVGGIGDEGSEALSFVKISDANKAISITPKRAKVLAYGESIKVSSLVDVAGLSDPAEAWYVGGILPFTVNGTSVTYGTYSFSGALVNEGSTEESATAPYAYGADFGLLTFTAPAEAPDELPDLPANGAWYDAPEDLPSQAPNTMEPSAELQLKLYVSGDGLKSPSTTFGVWIGNTVNAAIVAFGNGLYSQATAIADSTANVFANISALSTMAKGKTLKYVGFTDSDENSTPTVHLTAQQLVDNFALLTTITDDLTIVVDGTITDLTESLEDQLAELGSLDFEAGDPTIGNQPALSSTPTLAQYLANTAGYDAVVGGVTVSGGAQPIADAQATLAAHAAVKGVEVSDTSAEILAQIDTLAKLPVSKVTSSDGLPLVVASATRMNAIVKTDAKVLAAFTDAVTFEVDTVSGSVSIKSFYDVSGKQTSATYSDGRVATWVRNADGSHVVHWTGVSGQTYTSYDAVFATTGKQASATYSDGRAASWTWNADGSYLVHWTGISGQTYTSYDAVYGSNGKQTSASYSDGRTATWARNADGSYVVHWTGIPGQTYTSYDAVFAASGKQTSASYSDGRAASWTWNADGSYAVHWTGISGQTYTSYDAVYGSNGKQTSASYSDGRAATWTWNADGSYVMHWTGISGQTYTSYDAVYGSNGKQTSASYSDGLAASWTWNADGSYVVHWTGIPGQTYTSYDAVFGTDGKQTSASYSDGRAAAWARNADGSYVVHWTGITGQTYGSYDTVYGSNGKQTSASYSDGRAATWTWNADGSYAVHWTGIPGQTYTSYDAVFGADGKQTSASYSDGRRSTWAWNADGSREVETTGIPSTGYDKTEMFYGANGRLVTEVWSKAGKAIRVENWATDGSVANDATLTASKATQSAPFGGKTSIDLRAFDPTNTTLGFTEDASNTFGVLSLTDGRDTLALTLLGQFTAANFATAADGAGGLVLSWQPAPVALVG